MLNLHPLQPVSEETELSFMIKRLTAGNFVMWDHADVFATLFFPNNKKTRKGHRSCKTE